MNSPTDIKALYMQIGALIRRKRKALGQTQADLASRMRLARASIANIETGRQKIMVHQVYQLASALQMQVADLLPTISSESINKHLVKSFPLPDDLTPKQRVQISHLLGDLLSSEENKE